MNTDVSDRSGRLSLEKTLRTIAKFVEKNKGTILDLYKAPLYNDEPKIFNYSARHKTSTTGDFDIASGFSFNKEVALIRVLAEAIERFSLSTYRPRILARKTAGHAARLRNFIDPLLLSPFSKHQLMQNRFEKFRIKKTSRFNWTNAYLLSSNKKVLVPAQLMSFMAQSDDLIVMPINSTGTAFGLTLEDALYRAICEVVERDAFVIAYLNKIPSPQVSLDKIRDKEISYILSILQRYRLELVVMDLTTDIGIPVFCAIIVDKTGLGPSVSVGLKAGVETRECLIGAIEEALMTRSWIRDRVIYMQGGNVNAIKDIQERAELWFPTNMIKKLDFWLKSDNKSKIKITRTKTNRWELTKKSLEDIGIGVIYKNISPDEVRNSNLFVVRVLIPSLQQFYLDEAYQFFGNKRLYEVPIKLKFTNRRKDESGLNSIPHPFL